MRIFKFETTKNYYIYDVYTNNILKVAPIVFDIIDDVINESEPTEILSKYKGKYKPEEMYKAISEINLLKSSHKLFYPLKEFRLEFPYNYHDLKEILNSKLEQLILNVTESCNLNCEYCVYSGHYIFERTHSNKKMPFEVAKKAINFFFERNKKSEFVAVTFYGGEPLLNFGLIQRCVSFINMNYSKTNNKINFAITTNGTLLHGRILDFLVENNFSILISLDGPQDVHDRYRKYKSNTGSFAKIMKNIESFYKKYKEYYLSQKIGFSIVLVPPLKAKQVLDFFSSEELLKSHRVVITFPSLNDTTFLNVLIKILC